MNSVETKYKVGDLIRVSHDSYIFVEDKAFMIRKGALAVVVGSDTDGPDLDIFSKGRRAKWKGSVKICDEFGRSGWCHAANVEII
tara:strand:- start:611 stop:865 length:255 start_codon:yes stop_codon:yes gene_type:complete